MRGLRFLKSSFWELTDHFLQFLRRGVLSFGRFVFPKFVPVYRCLSYQSLKLYSGSLYQTNFFQVLINYLSHRCGFGRTANDSQKKSNFPDFSTSDSSSARFFLVWPPSSEFVGAKQSNPPSILSQALHFSNSLTSKNDGFFARINKMKTNSFNENLFHDEPVRRLFIRSKTVSSVKLIENSLKFNQ